KLSGGRGDRRRRARCRYSLCGHKLAVAGRTSGTALTVRRYLIANRAGVTQKKSCSLWRAGRRVLGYIRAVLRMLAARPGFALLACCGFIAAAIEAGSVHSRAAPVRGYYHPRAPANPAFLAMAAAGRQH